MLQIGIVLGNLVLEDEMIAESVPRQFAQEAMILMEIMAKIQHCVGSVL